MFSVYKSQTFHSQLLSDSYISLRSVKTCVLHIVLFKNICFSYQYFNQKQMNDECSYSAFYCTIQKKAEVNHDLWSINRAV